MEYRLSEQELKDLMHRSWLKAKNFYSGNTDEYFYDYFESEKKQLTIHSVVKSLKDKYTNEFWFWLERFESEDDSNRLWWYKKDVMLSTEEMWQEYNRLKTTL